MNAAKDLKAKKARLDALAEVKRREKEEDDEGKRKQLGHLLHLEIYHIVVHSRLRK